MSERAFASWLAGLLVVTLVLTAALITRIGPARVAAAGVPTSDFDAEDCGSDCRLRLVCPPGEEVRVDITGPFSDKRVCVEPGFFTHGLAYPMPPGCGPVHVWRDVLRPGERHRFSMNTDDRIAHASCELADGTHHSAVVPVLAF